MTDSTNAQITTLPAAHPLANEEIVAKLFIAYRSEAIFALQYKWEHPLDSLSTSDDTFSRLYHRAFNLAVVFFNFESRELIDRARAGQTQTEIAASCPAGAASVVASHIRI